MVVDVSGVNKAGEIRSLAKMNNSTSGSYKANTSSGYGGNIDITANQVEISQATIEAKGKIMGGKVRIGGDYLGGKKLTNTDKNNIHIHENRKCHPNKVNLSSGHSILQNIR